MDFRPAFETLPGLANDLQAGAVTPPVLREPQGWRYLEDHELASRLSVLLDAGFVSGSMTDGVREGEPLFQPEVSRSCRSNTSGEEVEARVAADGAALNALESPLGAVRQWAGLSMGLPVLAFAVSLAMAAPLLVWAPLLGGLCLGLAGLQFALVRRWLQQSQSLPKQDAAVLDFAAPTPHPQGMPTGVLLAGFLGVFGLLAVIVLYTAAIRNRDAAAMAQIHTTQPAPSREAQGQKSGLSPLLTPEADHEPQHRSHP